MNVEVVEVEEAEREGLLHAAETVLEGEAEGTVPIGGVTERHVRGYGCHQGSENFVWVPVVVDYLVE